MKAETRRERIASKLKAVREQHGLTQKEIADLVGVAASSISNYETGYRSPDIQTLEMFAEQFKIPLAELLCLDASETANLSGIDIPGELKDLDIESIKVLKEIKESGMGAEEIKAVLELVKTIRKTK